jgi:hypothetical protein
MNSIHNLAARFNRSLDFPPPLSPLRLSAVILPSSLPSAFACGYSPLLSPICVYLRLFSPPLSHLRLSAVILPSSLPSAFICGYSPLLSPLCVYLRLFSPHISPLRLSAVILPPLSHLRLSAVILPVVIDVQFSLIAFKDLSVAPIPWPQPEVDPDLHD